jgi:16S rRNA (cytidine1402-2'-O)-methyltransferase
VDAIAAEDTRTFKEFSSALKLNVTRVLAYHDHNEEGSAEGLLSLLKQGQSIALVSDAGTPGIADPGYALLKKAFENQITVEPLPGASSLTTALSACPIGGATHAFFGFAPSKASERKAVFQSLKNFSTRSVFFESPHRFCEHVEDAREVFGNVKIFVAREISKKFQEYLYTDIDQIIAHFKTSPPKGEFVIVYPPVQGESISQDDIEKIIRNELAKGRSSKEILEILKGQSSLSRSEAYDLIQKLKEDSKKV